MKLLLLLMALMVCSALCPGTMLGQERTGRPLEPVDLSTVWHSEPGVVPEHTVAYDTLVAGIISQVDLDTLISFVRILSGEDSVAVAGRTVRIRERSSQGGSDLAAAYLKQKLQSYGLEVIDQKYSSTGRNIYAVQRGYLFPERQYIICAHYDAVTEYCADDNASGAAAVLEASRLLSRYAPKYTVVYALWDEEELGFYGSQYYASQVLADQQQIQGVLNMDMLGWDGDNDYLADIHTTNTVSSTDLANLFVAVDDLYGLPVNPVVYNPGTWQSDHSVFWNYGWAAVLLIEAYYGGDLNPYYHSSEDRIARFNLPYFRAMGALSIGVLTTLIEPTPGPTITTIDPDTGYQSYAADIRIEGFKTHFLNTPEATKVWLSKEGAVLDPDSLRIVDSTVLHAHFAFSTATPLGAWDVNVETATEGTLSRPGGFSILPPPARVEVSPESLVIILEPGAALTRSLTVRNNGESDLGFSLLGGSGTGNHAVWLDGVDDFVAIGDRPSLRLTGAMTLECWIQFEAGGTFQPRIISKGPDGSGYELLLTNQGSSCNLELRIQPVALISRSLVSAGTWYHVAAVYDGSYARIYLNGLPDNEISAPGSLSTSAIDLFLGQKSTDAFDKYRGRIEEVRIWNIARGEQDINECMNRQLVGTEAGLVGYWQFNEGTGVRASDGTANSNHGTLNGGARWVPSSAPLRPGWFHLSPDSGVCPPHASTDILFAFDATELDTGDYRASVLLKTSDPFRPEVTVPIHLTVSGAVGVEGDAARPLAYGLEQNYPNPFNASTTITYVLPRSAVAQVRVYDVLGREVSVLVNERRDPGVHKVRFDASGLASGVYVYRLRADQFVQSRTLLLLR